MREIIIAYPIKETALQLRLLLESEGYSVPYICSKGSSVLGIAQGLGEGIIVCASILSDMAAGVLADNLPVGFDVISLSKNGREEYTGNLITIPLPVSKNDFLQTVEILASSHSSFTQGGSGEGEKEIIEKAKLVLMNSMDMTESRAHSYLQQQSMRTGKRLLQLAIEIINDFTQ